MQNIKHETHISKKRFLGRADAAFIRALQTLCETTDKITLKLELDYKLAEAQNSQDDVQGQEFNEFLYVLDGELIGYLGICGFGGGDEPLELTGMVHPQYRGMGLFKALSIIAVAECRRRNAASVLGLCDRNAKAGQAMVTKRNLPLHHSEYEMILRKELEPPTDAQLRGVTLRKAINADAAEIARQDRIYFGEEFGTDDAEVKSEGIRLPEEEEKRGFTIYLAVKNGAIIGKVNLQLLHGIGGIYGLGVVPNERGKGYGRAILLLAVSRLLQAKAESVYLQVLTDNEKALALYQSCGFETSSVMDYFKLI